jgi:putative transposase
MPRAARILSPDGFFHIITRGNNRQAVFRKPADFQKFKSILLDLKKDHMYQIYQFCLMTNHVHLLLKTVSGHALPTLMKKINLRYVQYYRKRYGHIGHFWQDRYKSFLINRDAYLLECAAYVELNPLKAGMERRIGDYEYTSYGYYAFGRYEPLLTPNPYYEEFGVTDKERQRRYRQFIVGRIERWEDYGKDMHPLKKRGRPKVQKGDGSILTV